MRYRTSPRSGLFETMILHQNTITKWSKYLMCRYPSNVSKVCMLMIFETIWNCRDHFENIVSKACTLAVLETISNCKANFKTMSLKHALWRYLKRFGTAEKLFENNDGKWCIMATDGSWNDLELQTKMKTISLKHALWRYFKRFGTAENPLKTRYLKVILYSYLILKKINERITDS